MIYLKFLAAVLANVAACAHTSRTFTRTATVKVFNLVISLWWMSRDRFFSVNLPLPATQVHIKARSSCITADRTSKRNALSSPSHSSHFHFLIFDPPFFCASFISLSLSPFLLLSPLPRVFFRTQLRVVRACIQCLERMERCMYRNHI